MRMYWWTTGLVLALALCGLSATTNSTGKVRTFVGETKDIGDGYIRTWMTADETGTPLSIGVVFPASMLENLPEVETEYMLALPPQAAVTAFDHFALNWMPHGHVPPGIYDVPHFDFHFYMITPQAREQITVTGEDLARVEKAPAPEFVPPGYMATPGGEPHMGAHWVPQDAPELHGNPFTETPLYGFYDGRMVFIEPMIMRAFLLSRPNVKKPLSLPAAYPTSAYYPTGYAIKYDPTRQLYIVTLQGLTMR